MKTRLVFLAVVLHASVSAAQGTISGWVADKSGSLPGVQVVAKSSSSEIKAVTDASGCYRLTGVEAGTYSLTAALPGFVTATREGVVVANGGLVDHVDFELCPGALEYIDWIVPGGLSEAWREADVVAYVRIVKTTAVRSDCPTKDVMHTAAVIEFFKEIPAAPIGNAVTFRQENWASEPAPYKIGQNMFVFLKAARGELWRLAGPYYVFLVNGETVVSVHSPISTEGITPADFAAQLRALSKRQKIP